MLGPRRMMDWAHSPEAKDQGVPVNAAWPELCAHPAAQRFVLHALRAVARAQGLPPHHWPGAGECSVLTFFAHKPEHL